ncbi:hypothetical protein QYE76_002967 [Lolium multiflorum]|uniref:Arabidopsis retrotransposon Orf1 C-terminal domain-containing protein n=1 Tax=Lolium multiflorum TaxID=4521 RepID=A0AAD8VYT5_LOLMU|nr:hypothetical protein QYE76_002967 [Lolium multiflorum]
MGKTRDTKVAILPSTTRKGTTLSTSAALDSPSVIDKLVSPPHASNAGTSAESENSHNTDNISAVLDDSGSLGTFLDAKIARSRQIENAETPDVTTPVNSPELEYSSDDLDEDYVELDDDFIEKCHATTDARKIKKLLAEHARVYNFDQGDEEKLPEAWARFCSLIRALPDHDLEKHDLLDIFYSGLTIESRAYLDSCAGCVFRKRTPDDAEELLAKIGRNYDDWTTPEPTPTPIVKKRGLIKLNDEDMREAKKSLKEKGIKSEDVKNLPPIEDICEIIPPSSMIEKMKKFKFGELFKKGTTSTGRPSRTATQIRRSYNEDIIAPSFAPEEDNGAPNASSFPCYDFLTNAGILDDFFTLVNRAGLATYVGDEREQYHMLTKIFVESFKFQNTEYNPTVAFKIYGTPVTMELDEFCRALDIAPVGTARRIDNNPRDLLELYRGITNDDCRTIQRGKIRNIQLPAIKYFAYYVATSILGRENTSNISSYHLAFLNIALTGHTSYHLGSLIARRLSTKGPIFGGTIALRILTHLELPIDPNDVPLTPRRLDIIAMKSHQFVTTESTLDNMAYRMLFADGDEKEIPLPQPGLFDIDRQPWLRTKEEVDEHMKIQDFHQQHDSEDAEPSYDYTVTYPGASSSTYPEYDPSSSYYGDTTSWDRWN